MIGKVGGLSRLGAQTKRPAGSASGGPYSLVGPGGYSSTARAAARVRSKSSSVWAKEVKAHS